MKLDERDERILAALGTRERPLSDLDAALDLPRAELERRLAALVDNGLVAERAGDRYERSESGRRVLLTAAAGDLDERIDTPPAVERALSERDLRADEADAVRHAFALLRYWGRVTEAEIVDAVYSEAPAGRETPAAWWDDLVSEVLPALPGVEGPTDSDDAWRYTGAPEVGDGFADGRRVLSRRHPVYGDVKHALESLDVTEAERAAARAAFELLYRRGEATERELRESVYPEHAAGYATPEEWWGAVVADAFEAIPGVERAGADTWLYRPP